jgi:prophage DNA circulation protein
LWNGVPGGIIAAPGNYYARFKLAKDSAEVPFTVKADPNYKITQQEYEQQFSFLQTVLNKFNETQKAIKDIRALRTQISSFVSLQGKDVPKDIKQMADSINKNLTAIEETLYQTKAKSSQDVLNFPIKLNDKLSGLFDVANSGNFAPSKQSKDVYADLASQIDRELNRLKQIKEKDIPAFNEAIRQKALPVIGIKE